LRRAPHDEKAAAWSTHVTIEVGMDRKTAAKHLMLVLGSTGSSDRLDFRPSSSRQKF
jgi:hypothetical protein